MPGKCGALRFSLSECANKEQQPLFGEMASDRREAAKMQHHRIEQVNCFV